MAFECRACRAENEPGDSFCHQCGERLQIAMRGMRPARQTDQPVLLALRRRLCAAIGETGAQGAVRRAALRRRGTQIHKRAFCGPERTRPRMSKARIPRRRCDASLPVLALMSAAVHQHDGVVAETLGDGVLALFGAPKPLEDHAVRACLAGLAMQQKIAELNDPSMRIRVGIHSGEAIVKAVDATLTQKLGAIGEVVHFANRIEQLCAPGDVTISEAGFKQSRQYIDAHSLGFKQAKGLSEPIEVYRVAGLRSAPASSIFRTREHLQPLAGRVDEIAQLEAALESAARGQACVVALIGEAGVGKSRICYEFLESCRRRDISILEARAAPFGEATPLKPMLDLLQDFFRIRPISDPQLRRQTVTTLLQRLPSEPEDEAMILELLGLTQGSESNKPDPSVRRARLIKFICQLVQQRRDRNPAVVLIEDLHWLDLASMDLLDAVVDAVYGSQTMLLLNFRPGLVRDWMQRSHYRALNLERLDAEAMDALVVYSLGEDEALTDVRADLVARSDGNPFFLEELTWALIGSGGLKGRPGAYRAPVHSISRLCRRRCKAFCLPASMHWIPFPEASANRGCDSSRNPGRGARGDGRNFGGGAAHGPADAPARRAHLRAAADQQNALLAFRHPLIQEVAYHNLLSDQENRASCGSREDASPLFQDRMDEGAAIWPTTWKEPGTCLAPRKRMHAPRLGWAPMTRLRPLLLGERCTRILRTQPSRPDIDFLRARACGQIVNLGWREGLSATEARGFFEEASKLALASKNFRGNALLHAAYGRILAAAGSADEYVAKIKEAQLLGNVAADASLHVTLQSVLAHALRLSGRLNDALAVNGEALGHCSDLAKYEREVLGFDLEPWLLAMRGQTLVSLGRGGEARPFLEQVIAMDGGRIDVAHHVIPSLAYVEWAWATQNCELAQEHAERAVGIGNGSHSPYLRVLFRLGKGTSSRNDGQEFGSYRAIFFKSRLCPQAEGRPRERISPFGGPRQCPPLREGG